MAHADLAAHQELARCTSEARGIESDRCYLTFIRQVASSDPEGAWSKATLLCVYQTDRIDRNRGTADWKAEYHQCLAPFAAQIPFSYDNCRGYSLGRDSDCEPLKRRGIATIQHRSPQAQAVKPAGEALKYNGPRVITFPTLAEREAEKRRAQEARIAEEQRAKAIDRAVSERLAMEDFQRQAVAKMLEEERKQAHEQQEAFQRLINSAPSPTSGLPSGIDWGDDGTASPEPGSIFKWAADLRDRVLADVNRVRDKCGADSFSRILCNKIFVGMPLYPAGVFVSGSRDVDEIGRLLEGWEAGQ